MNITKNTWLLLGIIIAAFALLAYIGSRPPVKGPGSAFTISDRCEVNQSYTVMIPRTVEENITEQVPYLGVEYFAEVPYEALEPYTEQQCNPVDYTNTECSQEGLSYIVQNEKCFSGGSNKSWWATVECTIANNDSRSGYFYIYSGFFLLGTSKTNNLGVNDMFYIYSDSSKTVNYTHFFSSQSEIKNYRCYCYAQSLVAKETCSEVQNLHQQCTQVTGYRNVTGYRPSDGQISLNSIVGNRTVVRYRDEAKLMNVTIYQNETMYKASEENC